MAQLPIAEFLKERLVEYDPEFELRKGTAFEHLFFKPMEFITQPFRDEANEIYISQSFLRILRSPDPDGFDEEAVDALAANLYVTRRGGNKSSGVVRAYYNEPVDREYPATGAVWNSSGGDVFVNPATFVITVDQMSIQVEDGLFYFDIPIESEEEGDIEVAVAEIVELVGDDDVIRVTNKLAFSGGVARETNVDFIARIQQSIAVRDLLIGKGFSAILFENFPNTLLEVQPVGFGDDEMMRDILYNTHIGGKVDGYSKTGTILTGEADFVGLLLDTTRQTFSSANVLLDGVAWATVGQPNIDRSNGLAPTVKEIKLSSAAVFHSAQDLSGAINLSTNQHVRIGIDSDFRNIRIAGVVPSATTRNEIINLINISFGVTVAFPEGNSLKIQSTTVGLDSSVIIDNPTVGNSAIFLAFGLLTGLAPHEYSGDGPITFVEGFHYEVDDEAGKVRRVVGPDLLTSETTGDTVDTSAVFTDLTANQFLAVSERDILTIETGADVGDYRILEKTDINNLVLDAELTATASGIQYSIRRTGIKDNELVYVEYYYNPLSIDIGKNIVLDEWGRERGIRPGREEQTITDLAFLRIRKIEQIDPLTLEPTGTVLDGTGGYGQGGYGQGGYGIGEGSEYRLSVVSPHERFSMFEHSYIVINSGLQGLSFKVTYDYVPEIEQYHDFVRTEAERILGGDILMKHLLPVYVRGTITYSIDETDATIPDNATLTEAVYNYINTQRAGVDLEYSDIIQFIVRTVDPFDKYGSFIKTFELDAVIHNVDGTILKITGKDKLVIPTLDPFPIETTRPLSSRITHWIADKDNLILERI